jgi:hypothetical protein
MNKRARSPPFFSRSLLGESLPLPLAHTHAHTLSLSLPLSPTLPPSAQWYSPAMDTHTLAPSHSHLAHNLESGKDLDRSVTQYRERKGLAPLHKAVREVPDVRVDPAVGRERQGWELGERYRNSGAVAVATTSRGQGTSPMENLPGKGKDAATRAIAQMTPTKKCRLRDNSPIEE